ncbi:hypothetical protein, partial [Streptococcus pneumoniae]|uniref:hypothetical protein n=1 Tax=Streptococcus pneumoniae TaxID=1313 RepID=UPI001E4A3CC8
VDYMADFCNTCYADFEYDNLAREWFVENPKTVDSERLFLRKIYGFDEIPKTAQSQWRTMICEGCSRKGTLICIVDDGGYC